MSIYRRFIKRAMDVILSSSALLVLSPLMVSICLLICLDSDGAPFFRQKRFGKGLKPFYLIKFRSMTANRRASLGSFEPGDTKRVTRMGRLLRKTKLDELPELFNVVRGEMSIVGPRPDVEKYVTLYPEKFKKTLTIRPGLSDFASIKYKNEEALLRQQPNPEAYYRKVVLPDKLRLATAYADNLSLKTDIQIILTTIKSLFNL